MKKYLAHIAPNVWGWVDPLGLCGEAKGSTGPGWFCDIPRPLAKVLEGHGPGQGFSTVYDEATGNLLMKPSKAGELPPGWVPRRGGHAYVSKELGGNASSHHGLATIIQDDETLRLTWRSGQLNSPANDYLVPTELRPTIIKAIEDSTGRKVSSS